MKTPRLSIGSGANAGQPRSAHVSSHSNLEVLRDTDGTVIFGWLSPTVFYTRFVGGLSAQSGEAYATRLGMLVAKAHDVSFFCDSSRLQQYDLLARSAFVRAVLTNRRRFIAITMLTWAEGISKATTALVDTLGEPITVLTDGEAFDAQLLRAAPLARRKLDPRTWERATPLTPGIR